MTEPDFTPMKQPTPANRIAELGSEYIAALALKSTFDSESELALKTRRMTYEGLPKELTPDEMFTLTGHIGSQLIATEMTPERDITTRERRAAQVRALRWLGSRSMMSGDQVTTESVSHTLRGNLGLRGKLAALSLWYERTVKN